MTGTITEEELRIRKTTIVVMAYEELDESELRDPVRVLSALQWARSSFFMGYNDKHFGDCTKVPMTCMRCYVDNARERAVKIISMLDRDSEFTSPEK